MDTRQREDLKAILSMIAIVIVNSLPVIGVAFMIWTLSGVVKRDDECLSHRRNCITLEEDLR